MISKKIRRPVVRNGAGITLVELMISMVILVVAAIGVMGVFIYVARSIQHSKCRGLASNLSQEQIQVLKQKNYYRVLVTTSTAFRTEFSPPVAYDTGYFPPETILEGGITFTRLTHVAWAMEDSGNIVGLAPTASETNLKLLTVTTLWNVDSAWHKLEIRNVLSNPDAVVASSLLTGTVTSGGAPLANALVTVSENTGALDSSDSTGRYRINLFAGDYNLTCEAEGHFAKTASVSVAPGGTATANFDLIAMASATLSGQVWVNDHLVISRVVGSSPTASGFDQEYVEIFNPTTWTWTMNGEVGLTFQRKSSQDATPVPIAITYSGASIAPGGFYLFANTTPVSVAGATLNADAVWECAPGGSNETRFSPRFVTAAGLERYNVIPVSEDGIAGAAGGLRLCKLATGEVLDAVGWSGDGGQPPGSQSYETAFYVQTVGLQRNELFSRFSTPSGVSGTLGPAYDSNNNHQDWNGGNIGMAPRSSASGTLPIYAGTPAIGAGVTCNDGLSASAVAVTAGSPPVAQFSLPAVATGTWTVFLASGTKSQEILNVTVAAAGTIGIPNAATTPAWPAANRYDVFLSTVNEEGYISGTVRNAANAAIAPAIVVSNGSRSTTASTTTGAYLFKSMPGPYTVWANPNNGNANYVSDSVAGVVVVAGQVASNVNFTLAQAGKIRGFVTRDGINPLPGVAVTATNAAGFVESNQVSGSDGRFTMANVSTGSYVVEPVLNPGETASPASANVAVAVGSNVWSATFTVVGAMGGVRGSVTKSGLPIKTGVTVIVTTTTIAGVPPALTQAGLAGVPYYAAASNEDGSYSLDVRGSTSTAYRVYAYFPVRSATGWTINTGSAANVWVTPGISTTTVNFNW